MPDSFSIFNINTYVHNQLQSFCEWYTMFVPTLDLQIPSTVHITQVHTAKEQSSPLQSQQVVL